MATEQQRLEAILEKIDVRLARLHETGSTDIRLMESLTKQQESSRRRLEDLVPVLETETVVLYDDPDL